MTTDANTPFATEHWYVVASRDELADGPVGRVVVDQPIVLFLDADDRVVALSDRCPHRRYPLSRGRISDGILVCGYHGFSFDGTGTCVAVPGQNQIPSRANVRSYPVVERGPWVFAWMGDPATADPDALPPLPWLTDPAWATVHGMRPLAAGYELLVDNLLDLSHETYLHAGFIGTPEVAATPVETSVDETRAIVYASRHMEGVECPPFYEESTGITSPIDRSQDSEFHAPGMYILHSRVAPAGLPPSEERQAAHTKIIYGITPSTATTTYDFWLVARDFAVDDPSISKFLENMNDEVVGQDVDALEELHRCTSVDPDPFEVNIRIDRGGLHARRVIRAQIEAEHGSGS